MPDNGSLPLAECLQVTVSEDKMQAYLVFRRVEGDLKLTSRELEQYISSQGIKHGVQSDTLYLIAQKPQDFFFTQNVIAIGTPPLPGIDGYVKVLYGESNEQERRPTEREDGSVDYKEVKQLANVKAGQLIAERVPAQKGTAGKAVTGEEILPKEGKDAHFKVGKNVVVNPEKVAMYAAIDGLVTKTDKEKLNVFPVYEVNGDVDYNIGNIDFVGTVVIRGNILTGFRVKASGDIRVTGGIEGAEVESDGSIEISGGIIGSNKGFVKAGRNIRCSFIQEGNVFAGEDIVVAQSIMHANVRAGRSVKCAGAKGLIVGGLIQAGDRVTARMIGNSMSTATVIEVGVRPELRQELNELRVVMRQLTENMDKSEKALALLDQMASIGQLSADKLALRVKLSATKRQAIEDLAANKERVLEIEKTLEDTTTARVDAVHTLWGGTKIVIGRYTRFVKDSSQRVSFRFSDGDIIMVPFF
ncbi:FapA family protein [Cohnella silvisoli]|uniref:FapA family protein n=1 Tax=Cohnella silvisoli TaxID=2873699 RepID=A0ABV1KWM6_9BACL|nr:FapA family protein [Cohnella silvisoli]MCD9023388.1 FapA family protein [Cohnella silvisoli]